MGCMPYNLDEYSKQLKLLMDLFLKFEKCLDFGHMENI
jgi:hypothetical protein